MRLGQVIGRLTLNAYEPTFQSGRFLVVLPLSRKQIGGGPLKPLPQGNSLVVYDNLGAGLGNIISYVEGREASVCFPEPTPVDAFNCAIIDEMDYDPPQ